MTTHIHRLRPLWLMPMSPANVEGWHRVLARCRCVVCGVEIWVAGEQSPAHLQGRVLEEGE